MLPLLVKLVTQPRPPCNTGKTTLSKFPLHAGLNRTKLVPADNAGPMLVTTSVPPYVSAPETATESFVGELDLFNSIRVVPPKVKAPPIVSLPVLAPGDNTAPDCTVTDP